jgi:hypothetical protein
LYLIHLFFLAPITTGVTTASTVVVMCLIDSVSCELNVTDCLIMSYMYTVSKVNNTQYNIERNEDSQYIPVNNIPLVSSRQ